MKFIILSLLTLTVGHSKLNAEEVNYGGIKGMIEMSQAVLKTQKLNSKLNLEYSVELKRHDSYHTVAGVRVGTSTLHYYTSNDMDAALSVETDKQIYISHARVMNALACSLKKAANDFEQLKPVMSDIEEICSLRNENYPKKWNAIKIFIEKNHIKLQSTLNQMSTLIAEHEPGA
jgi:hypothetical protein